MRTGDEKRIGNYKIGGKSMLIGFSIAVSAIAAFFLVAIPQLNTSRDAESLMAHSETVAYHHHVTVKIESDGSIPTRPPMGIGIEPTLWSGHGYDSDGVSGYAPVHTHDASGVLHVESKTGAKYDVGKFLEIWGGLDMLRVYQIKVNSDYPLGSDKHLAGVPLTDGSTLTLYVR